jgi:hypothetical protein
MIIGVAGPAQHGKDTFAKYLMMHDTTYSFTRISFADPLKRELIEKFNLTEWHFYTNEGKKAIIPGLFEPNTNIPMTSRRLLQWWGTDVMRAICPDYWTNKMENELVDLKAVGVDDVIIPDTRFINEIEMIKANGGMMVKVEMTINGVVQEPRVDGNAALNHKSESDWKTWDSWDLVVRAEKGDMQTIEIEALSLLKKIRS